MFTKEEAKEIVRKIVERFEYHLDEYKKGNYNETQTRNDFINPFFEALGWDINNKQGLAESYREVIHEDKIKIGGHTKAPDYCFTIYGQRKFFLEAKKPSVSIKESIDPAYQLRRYGWSAKMPISIITDFEEFSIYDCTIKPTPQDKASVARINYLTYKDYLKEFDFLWDTFSKEMVLKGSFDKFVNSNKGKKGTADVDAEFLKSLDSWRDLLARNIVNRNKEIDEDTLNFSLQRIIDRLIFLRICEDRGIESENTLFETIGTNIYEKLKTIFHIADQKYNSGLFDYKKDKITDNLIIDDKILKTIIEEMYYPKCPYEFSVIPVEILGHSYEQYLGKVIRITPGHIIKIETKPEVRKAGGVYYTPQYIVDYIVKNTVGKIVEEKTPEEIADIRICDPACGSGSFLLGAYQFLLDWHRDYYKNNDVKKKEKFLTPDGNLTTTIKKQILLNNIFGVDIDTNAVEVTKLSLMLKAMEGESNASINEQMQLFHERVLPTLDNNIKSGNSLIDMDFYDSQIDFEPGVEKKIKPFNWESAFPQVFGSGGLGLGTGDKGFDVVIGNPPWVFTKYFDWGEPTKSYIEKSFLNVKNSISEGKARQAGKINLFSIFLIKGLCLLKEKGLFSYIIPNTILRTTTYDIIREYILNNTKILQIVDLKANVFEGVTASTIILTLEKNYKNINNNIHIIDQNINSKVIDMHNINIVNQDNFRKNISYTFNIFVNEKEKQYIDRIQQLSINLENLVNVCNGIATGPNKSGLHNSSINEKCKMLLLGKDIKRYFHIWNNNWIEYDPKLLHRARNEETFLAKEKIIMQRIGGILISSYDDKQFYTFNSVNNLLLKSNEYSIKYILGILNSKLLKHYYEKNFTNKSNLTVNISKTFLDKLPIRNIKFNESDEKQKHDEIVRNVETMLQLNKDLQSATLPEQKEQLQARISYTDKKIDSLVYQLYGLTEEEIRIVEGE